MPRDGLGNFTAYAPPVVTQTTIDSGVHNGIVADFVTDANAKRPIIAGGTAASSAKEARTNLQAEVAGAQVVNYDDHVFENGSFYSVIAANGAPNATDYFVGTAIILTPPNVSLVLVARSMSTGAPYVRLKTGGAWAGPWVIDAAGEYVNTTGDTMTGNLTVPALLFNPTNYILSDATNLLLRTNGEAYVQDTAGVVQQINVGAPGAATHATTKEYVDIGVTGANNNAATAQSTANTAVANAAAAQSTANAATSNANNRLLRTTDTLTGDLTVTNAVFAQYLYSGGGGHITGNFTVGASINAINVYAAGQVSSNSNTFHLGAPGQAAFRSTGEYGGGYALQSNSGSWGALFEQSGYICLGAGNASNVATGLLKMDPSGHMTINGHGWQPGGGTWGDSASDARVKNVLREYQSGLDAVLGLDPVVYTFKGNDGGDDSPHKAFAASGKEFTGLIAQQVETVMPEMVIQREGVIDGQPVADFRMLDTAPLIYALVNAIKELTARIEDLEARMT